MLDGIFAEAERRGFVVNQWPDEFAEVAEWVRGLAPRTRLEIGVQFGGWAWAISHYCPTGLRYVGVDIQEYPEWKAWRPAMSERGVNAQIIVASSQSEATVALARTALGASPVDLLHIDGDHTEAGCLRDYDLYSPLVRSGGMVIFHDIGSDKGPRQALEKILHSERARHIVEVRTICRMHWERPERRMGVAMLRMQP